MILKGKAWKFGDNLDTDAIVPARYLNTSDPDELAAHCMEEIAPDFIKKVRAGDIIVAGKNFGCGSSREHAPVAIKQAGISAVLAGSFARIFYRNAFNMGLPILESHAAAAEIDTGDNLELDLESGLIINHSRGQTYKAQPVPDFMRLLLEVGGLIPYVQRKMKEDMGV
jgi:3-isopropylmalate/(R)-2-methylmalate dehydratase small subunit